MADSKIIGKTKGAGFQIGVRKTLGTTPAQAWEFITSKEGIHIWLGKGCDALELKGSFTTDEGTQGMVTTFKLGSHVRLSWKPSTWPNSSALQLRVIDTKGKATLSFHQDKLLDPSQREQMKTHWERVLQELDSALK